MHLRKLASHESNLLRELRLRALQESPGSFRDTYADAAAQPPSYWEDLARSTTEPGRNAMFLAYEEHELIGSAFALVDSVRSRTGRVGGMWVDPRWRRQGIGEALLQAVIDWARERGFERLMLWCAANAAGPGALYRKAGFRETGNQQPLSDDSPLRVVEMELPL